MSLVKDIPADRLLIETDAPYLIPRTIKPKPKTHRNEPENLPHVCQSIADALGENFDLVAARTTRNAKRFFGLTDAGR